MTRAMGPSYRDGDRARPPGGRGVRAEVRTPIVSARGAAACGTDTAARGDTAAGRADASCGSDAARRSSASRGHAARR